MVKVEYKKINYIFSINNCVEDNVRKLSLTEESLLFINKLNNYYNKNIKTKMNDYKLSIDDKKKILNEFLNKIPSELMILRNHIKNCMYCSTISEFDFKYKTVKEDINRLKFINRG